MIKTIICTKCPKGCEISGVIKDGKTTRISGNSCKAGLAFATGEFNDPRRILTTTVKVAYGTQPLISVKSEKPLPKPLLLACMQSIKDYTIEAPVKIGDIVIKDLLHTGINMLATKTVPRI